MVPRKSAGPALEEQVVQLQTQLEQLMIEDNKPRKDKQFEDHIKDLLTSQNSRSHFNGAN